MSRVARTSAKICYVEDARGAAAVSVQRASLITSELI